MKRINKTLALLMTCMMVTLSSVFVACDDSNELDTNQIRGGVSLSAAQLQVTRGGYMQFKGSGLNQIENIVFPDNVSVSDIEVLDTYTIRCLVPEDAVEGKVKLLFGGKTIETATIAFTEPITFESFTPASVTPGEELTIKGTYLNYIDHVIFASGDAVEVTPTRYEIKVIVPVDASSGKVYLSMNVIEGTDTLNNQLPSKEELVVVTPNNIKLPTSPVKSGSPISITGSLLRLVEFVRFQNADDVNVAQLDPTKEISALSVTVPVNAQTGEVVLMLLSGIEIIAGEITLVQPTATIEDKKTSYDVDDVVVISGSDLDLVSKAAFTNGEEIETTLTEDGKIHLTVTEAAQSGVITLILENGNTVSVDGFETTKPVISEYTPAALTAGEEVIITGVDLDLVEKIIFEGEGSPTVTIKESNYVDETTLKITVPSVAETCAPQLVLKNGMTVETTVVLDITPATDPAIAGMPESAQAGTVITITGKNLNYVEALYLGDTKVTEYTSRTPTEIIFRIPSSTVLAEHKIKMVNYEGLEFLSETMISVVGVDPVQDPSYVFFDFDGKGSWWGNYGEIDDDPNLSLSGKYFRINEDLPGGWVDFFWRNGKNDLKTDGVTVADWVIKMDVNVLGNKTQDFKFRLKGTDGDFWAIIPGFENKDGWYTVTIPLTDFVDGDGAGTNQIPNVQNVDSDFGMATAGDPGMVNMCIDNIRFEQK